MACLAAVTGVLSPVSFMLLEMGFIGAMRLLIMVPTRPCIAALFGGARLVNADACHRNYSM